MAFQDGLDISGGYSFAQASYMFDFDDGEAPMQGTASAAEGETSVSLNAQAMSYNTSLTDMAVSLTSPELPFPVDISAAEYGIGMALPMARTDEPADFSASINLVDLAVSDMIWSLVDPQGALPHDPATLVIELSGTGRLFMDLMDPESMEEMADSDMPGELNSVTLDDLRISIAGAELTGGGAFAFDNSDMTTFPGMPRPEGELGIKLVGGNQLLDTLVSMGLVPADAAMQGRMMMGMFANVTGDDQLETSVEVNGEGHLIVNGQRLQ